MKQGKLYSIDVQWELMVSDSVLNCFYRHQDRTFVLSKSFVRKCAEKYKSMMLVSDMHQEHGGLVLFSGPSGNVVQAISVKRLICLSHQAFIDLGKEIIADRKMEELVRHQLIRHNREYIKILSVLWNPHEQRRIDHQKR